MFCGSRLTTSLSLEIKTWRERWTMIFRERLRSCDDLVVRSLPGGDG